MNLDDDNKLPRTLIRCKPDWHAAEVVSPRRTDYYESNKALGILFRSITLDDPKPILPVPSVQQPLSDPITLQLLESVQRRRKSQFPPIPRENRVVELFEEYANRR